MRKRVVVAVVVGLLALVAYMVLEGVIPHDTEGWLAEGQPSVLSQSVIASAILIGVALFSAWLLGRMSDFPTRLVLDSNDVTVEHRSGRVEKVGWNAPRFNLRVLDAQDPSLVNPGIYLYNLGWPTRLTREAADAVIDMARSQRMHVEGPREGGLKGSTETLIRGPRGFGP